MVSSDSDSSKHHPPSPPLSPPSPPPLPLSSPLTPPHSLPPLPHPASSLPSSQSLSPHPLPPPSHSPSSSPPPYQHPPAFVHNGIVFPGFWSDSDWPSRFEAISEFDPRPDDVLVICYPKTGFHWSREFVPMILTGNTRVVADTKQGNFLEFNPIESFDAIPSPRMLITHLPFEYLPKKVIEKRTKIIRISRNPKDVAVSMFHHRRGHAFVTYVETFAQYLETFMNGGSQYGSYFEYERRYKDELGGADRIDHVFQTTFEDLRTNPLNCFRSIGRFLGVDRPEEFYQEVALQTSFPNLKRINDEKQDPGLKKGFSFYRKGEVGDWINHLTVAQSRQIDKLVSQYQLEYTFE